VSTPQILVVDDEPNLLRVVAAMLQREHYEVHTAASGAEAIAVLAEHHIDVVITDLKMPGVDGMAVLAHARAEHAGVPVILITAHGTVDTAASALKSGAFDYVTKPFDRDELLAVVAKAAKTRELSLGDVTPAERGRFRIIGQSAPMLEVYDVIDRVADTPSTVLVTGESGTGKELIARALHENSRRRDQPFVRVNCAAIPPDLLESELFGYERGAFTGAVTSKPGRFELAHGGTLFLDEIGEIPTSMQVKLLRALQEHEFERVGGIKTIRVDVRIVAATNRELEADVKQGRFREDLFYRLNVVHVHLAPLRDRPSDIPLLLEHLRTKLGERLERPARGFTPEAVELMLRYEWRGNIRELENVVERCLLFCDGPLVDVAHLPAAMRRPAAEPTNVTSSRPPSPPRAEGTADETTGWGGAFSDVGDAGLKEAVREATVLIERELIVRALARTSQNVTHAARLLRISRKSLQTKMKELGLRGDAGPGNEER
jgi:two-component system response regulator AtoC